MPPADYVDDVFHCFDPSEVRSQEISITCDPETWRWNIDELEEDEPPEVCDDQTVISELQAQNAEDWFEPCVLWAILYGNLQPTSEPTAMASAPTIPDDIYHCRDPSNVDRRESISCDASTFLWNVDELVPNRPPRMCGINFEIDAEEIKNVLDWFEPCVLWAMEFGNLRATPSPSVAPSISAAPSKKLLDGDDVESGNSGGSGDGNSNPGENDSTQTPAEEISEPSEPTDSTDSPNAPADTDDRDQLTIMALSPILLTYVWNNEFWEQSQGTLSLDRLELQRLTERHVQETLEAQIGLQTIRSIRLDLTLGPPQAKQWTEAIGGEIDFVDPSIVESLPPATLQRLYQQAFLGDALALYLFRLQIAQDPTLRKIQEVLPGSFGINNLDDQDNIDESDDGLDVLLVVMAITVAVAMLSLCACLYYFCWRKPDKTYHNPRGSVILVDDNASKNLPQNNKEGPRVIDQIPTIPTKSSSMDNDEVYLDEENQASLITMSELDDNSLSGFGGNVALMGIAAGAIPMGKGRPNDIDNQSVGTSVYSYYNDDQSLLGGTASGPLFSTKEDLDSSFDTVTTDVREKSKAKKKKGILWSVMDTLQTHFGNDTDADIDLSNNDLISPMTITSSENILGPSHNQGDTDSVYSQGLLYDDLTQTQSTATPGSIGTSSTENFDDFGNEQADDVGTPAKDRLEQLWKEEDEEQATTTSRGMSSPLAHVNTDDNVLLQATLKKSNLSARGSGGVKVFHDDEKDGPDELNISYESDDGPTAVLLESAGNVVQSVPPDVTEEVVQVNTWGAQDKDDANGEDFLSDMEEDAGLVVPLPSQLLAASNNDSISVSSSHSSHSSGSRGRKQLFSKRDSWGHASDSRSVSSAQSSDSAKYRSLLNQMDTNDAALFGLQDKEEEKPSRPTEDVESKQTSSQLSTLIQSFDAAWSNQAEVSDANQGPHSKEASSTTENQAKTTASAFVKNAMSMKKQGSSEPIDFGSDDEDIYVEDEDETEDPNEAVEVNIDASKESADKTEEKAENGTTPIMEEAAAAMQEVKETPQNEAVQPQTEEREADLEQEEIEVDMDDNVSIKSDSQNSAPGNESVGPALSALLVQEKEDEDNEKDEVGSFDGVEKRLPFENEHLEEDMVFPDEVEEEIETIEDGVANVGDEKVEDTVEEIEEEGYTSTMASF